MRRFSSENGFIFRSFFFLFFPLQNARLLLILVVGVGFNVILFCIFPILSAFLFDVSVGSDVVYIRLSTYLLSFFAFFFLQNVEKKKWKPNTIQTILAILVQFTVLKIIVGNSAFYLPLYHLHPYKFFKVSWCCTCLVVFLIAAIKVELYVYTHSTSLKPVHDISKFVYMCFRMRMQRTFTAFIVPSANIGGK